MIQRFVDVGIVAAVPEWFGQPWNTWAALGFSLLAIAIAAKNYRRKSGIVVRGTFSIRSTVECSDSFVSSVTLENMKDRAITIYAIYLHVSHNYYIELEDFDREPLILKAYETVRREYGPIVRYLVNGRWLDMGDLLKDDVKKRLVLSTADGKYTVPRHLRKWDPVHKFFSNHLTAIVEPERAIYEGKAIGDAVRYIVHLKYENREDAILLLRDDRFQVFSNFRIPADVYASAEAMSAYLMEKIESGDLPAKSCLVIDAAKQRAKAWKLDQRHEPIKARRFGWFSYHIVGRLLTAVHTRKLRRENARRRRERENGAAFNENSQTPPGNDDEALPPSIETKPQE